jgi:hypothetical protein
MLHNKGTDLYNNNGGDYKAAPYGGLHIQTNTPLTSQWGNSVQNQQKIFFFINSVIFFIHQAYNNKNYDDKNLSPILQHYSSSTTFQRMNNIFLSQQISINIGIIQI